MPQTPQHPAAPTWHGVIGLTEAERQPPPACECCPPGHSHKQLLADLRASLAGAVRILDRIERGDYGPDGLEHLDSITSRMDTARRAAAAWKDAARPGWDLPGV